MKKIFVFFLIFMIFSVSVFADTSLNADILEAIKNSTSYDDTESIIKENSSDIGIDSSTYDDLTSEEKEEVMEEITGSEFGSIDDLKNKFNELVTEKSKEEDNSASSGGGSGGGSGGVIISPTIAEGMVCENQYHAVDLDKNYVYINNKLVKFSADPVRVDNELLCPVREIFEPLDFTVSWNSSNTSLTVSSDDITMKIIADSYTISVNGTNFYTPVPAQIINNITYVPVTAVFNALGYYETKDDETNVYTYMESEVSYTLRSNGILTIKGSGIIPDYSDFDKTPWADYSEDITRIVIRDGVTSVGKYSFYDCVNIKSAELPYTVLKIESYAFPNTPSFSEIIYYGTFEDWNLISNSKSSNTQYVKIYYADGYIDYAPAEDFEVINGVIVKYLGSDTVVYIPEEINGMTVTRIGDEAFGGNGSCYHIIIPDTVTSIGTSAFYYCYNLRSINIPYGVTELDGTFASCSSLNSIDLPDTITTIGVSTFADCTELKELYLPNITSIGVSAFCYSGLTEFDIPNGVKSIPRNAFRECKNLTSINIPYGVESIGMFAFEGCENLTEISIPGSVELIGDGAFNSCKYLTEVELPKVQYISDGLFYDCYRLQNIIIPDTVSTVNTGAFTNCYSLTNVYYKGSESDWLNVTIDEDNEYLTNAAIHYNYIGTSECIVEFNTNGGYGAFSSLSVNEDVTAVLPEDVPVRFHHKFLGWALSSDAKAAQYLPLEEITVKESMVLYAVWEAVPYTETTLEEFDSYYIGTIKLYNVPDLCVLNIAKYKDGKLVCVESREYSKDTENFAVYEDIDEIKIMLWSTISSLKPLCEAEHFSITSLDF